MEKNLWENFAIQYDISPLQIELYKKYSQLIVSANTSFNITAITEQSSIITHHFIDSITLGVFKNMLEYHTLVDVGTGAGIPSIPLKIKYPHLSMILIEVTQKKVRFLQKVVDELSLKDIIIYDADWRTFLRKTDYQVDIFCARASLSVTELLRLFQPSSSYKNAHLIYWASESWLAKERESEYIKSEYEYLLEHKKRRLIEFAA